MTELNESNVSDISIWGRIFILPKIMSYLVENAHAKLICD